jgi:hypothetical protein
VEINGWQFRQGVYIAPPCLLCRFSAFERRGACLVSAHTCKISSRSPHSERPSSGVLVATMFQRHRWKIVEVRIHEAADSEELIGIIDPLQHRDFRLTPVPAFLRFTFRFSLALNPVPCSILLSNPDDVFRLEIDQLVTALCALQASIYGYLKRHTSGCLE